jgi:hypothetical protein
METLETEINNMPSIEETLPASIDELKKRREKLLKEPCFSYCLKEMIGERR